MRLRISTALLLGLLPLATWAAESGASANPIADPPTLRRVRGLSWSEQQAAEFYNQKRIDGWIDGVPATQRAATFAALGEVDARVTHRIESPPMPSATRGYDWRYVARVYGLNGDDVQRLARDKVLIEDVSFRQPFEPYTQSSLPLFITTDSLLGGFHALFADTFKELETNRAPQLKVVLGEMLSTARRLMARPDLLASAQDLAPGWRHAEHIVGPALVLLGGDINAIDLEVRNDVQRQVELIRAADRVELPSWFGPPASTLVAIDYRRFKPVGFYADSPLLQDYFRAVRWLQSVPFRADHDDELAAIGILSVAASRMERARGIDFFSTYDSILGKSDDSSLSSAVDQLVNFRFGRADRPIPLTETLARTRRWLLRHQLPSMATGKINDQLRFPPHANDKLAEIQFRIISAYRLPDTLALAEMERDQLPNGLIVAELLGSNFAAAQLASWPSDRIARALEAANKEWHAAGELGPPSLYAQYLDALTALFQPADSDAPEFMRSQLWQAKSCNAALASWAEMRHTFSLQAKEDVNFMGIALTPAGFIEPNPRFFSEMANLCESCSATFEAAGAFSPDVENRMSIRRRWVELASAARRLEALSQKQLRKQPWNAEEERFIKSYGARLADVMGYFSNSWEHPRDDTPRWVTVASEPRTNSLLAAAIGRPRLIHVLYPWDGGEILCDGSIASYYEYTGQDRLTDAEWREKLDSPTSPPMPSWFAPYVAR